MAKKPTTDPKKPAPKKKPDDKPVKTQMLGEHGDDDLGYDPSIIKTEPIPEDD
jgi:hypothetical protein